MKKCKKIVMFNPAISSLNMGDHIIFDGAKRELSQIIKDSFVVEVCTHLPVSNYLKYLEDFELRFVCGSNLLRGKMNRSFRQWDINLFQSKLLGECILVGVGWWQYGDEPNFYTKLLYKKILTKKYIHSVRDSYTERQLKKVGITNVLNTACPTMWMLDKEHCAKISHGKSIDVVFTITDYNQDKIRDKKLIEILCTNYENVYFWVQGTQDLEYFHTLNVTSSKIVVIGPSLEMYDAILDKDVDYIGTRLHAGIRALQKLRRTIIIAIDNRAVEKQRDFNLKCIERKNIEVLEELINSEFATDLNIPFENIKKWKDQFK